MGIDSFQKFVSSNIFSNVITKNIPPENVEGLSIDMNTLLHSIAAKVYAYSEKSTEKEKELVKQQTQEVLEANFYSQLDSKLIEIIDFIKPKKYLLLCVDGQCPFAKIVQQRSRRYVNLHENDNFNTANITPGTDFMIRLDKRIEYWIEQNRSKMPKILVYSSHLTKGEGEHKIFNILRSGLINEGDGNHVTMGLDADLVMLSSLSNFEKCFLYKEDKYGVSFINIDSLKKQTFEIMTKNWTFSKRTRSFFKLVIQDFVIMVYLLGNDFLPHTLALYSVRESMEMMLYLYNSIGLGMGTELNFSDAEGNIIWPAFAIFIKILADKEPELLAECASKKWIYPCEILDSVYKNKKYENDDKDALYVNFRTKWYNNAILPRNVFLRKYVKNNIDYLDNINLMCESYIFGLQWNLRYYLGGTITNTFFYSHIYVPLLSDISNYLQNMIEEENYIDINNVMPQNSPLENTNILHQLVSVIPPKSAYLIPGKWKNLILSGGELSYIAPIEFDVEWHAKNKEHEFLAILPPLNIDDIYKCVNDVGKLPQNLKNVDQWVNIAETGYKKEYKKYGTKVVEIKTKFDVENGERKHYVKKEYTKKEEGDKPYVKREEEKPYVKKEYVKKEEKPYVKREEGDKPYIKKEYVKKEEKPYVKREEENKPYVNKEYIKKEEGDKTYAKKEAEEKPHVKENKTKKFSFADLTP